MPLIFSHGSLQQPDTQVSLYGRVLSGDSDELVDFIRTQIAVPAAHKAAAAGVTHYANVLYVEGSGNRVAGKVFELTDAELTLTDAYEREAEYARISTKLASGRNAWVYVSARTP
jgi:gamma-glutamylcyclotransferase (GGCT)/AIG2-like uncharacterized protein YtfP